MTTKAFLDANVLFPGYLADLLLSIAGSETYLPLWSIEVMNELRRNLLNRVGMNASKIEKRIRVMNDSFPNATVRDYESLESVLTDVNAKDRHVLAAAIAAGASSLVTLNLKDFPREMKVKYGVELLAPDAFLSEQFSLNPEVIIYRLALLLKRWNNPKINIDQLILIFQGILPVFSASIEAHKSELALQMALL